MKDAGPTEAHKISKDLMANIISCEFTDAVDDSVEFKHFKKMDEDFLWKNPSLWGAECTKVFTQEIIFDIPDKWYQKRAMEVHCLIRKKISPLVKKYKSELKNNLNYEFIRHIDIERPLPFLSWFGIEMSSGIALLIVFYEKKVMVKISFDFVNLIVNEGCKGER